MSAQTAQIGGVKPSAAVTDHGAMRTGFIAGSVLQIFLIHLVDGAGVGGLSAGDLFAAKGAAVAAIKLNHNGILLGSCKEGAGKMLWTFAINYYTII